MHTGELRGNWEISDCTTSDVDVNVDIKLVFEYLIQERYFF